MENKLYLRFSKTSLFFFLTLAVYGQSWEATKTVELRAAPVSYTTDFQGNLFVGFADGRLSKYDPDGAFLENFSLSNNSSISLIDVQNNLKPFLFYFDNQQITILDRFSSVPKDYLLSDLNLEIGMMACPAPDGDFWIAENNPQRLKKVNPLRKITVLEVQVILGDSLMRMQAYQNLLVIAAENTLNIFDQFGGLINKIRLESLKDFQIFKGRLYAFADNEIFEINPFKGSVIEKLSSPCQGCPLLKSKEGFLTIQDIKVTYYRTIKP